eukprot:UN04266
MMTVLLPRQLGRKNRCNRISIFRYSSSDHKPDPPLIIANPRRAHRYITRDDHIFSKNVFKIWAAEHKNSCILGGALMDTFLSHNSLNLRNFNNEKMDHMHHWLSVQQVIVEWYKTDKSNPYYYLPQFMGSDPAFLTSSTATYYHPFASSASSPYLISAAHPFADALGVIKNGINVDVKAVFSNDINGMTQAFCTRDMIKTSAGHTLTLLHLD